MTEPTNAEIMEELRAIRSMLAPPKLRPVEPGELAAPMRQTGGGLPSGEEIMNKIMQTCYRKPEDVQDQ